MIPRRWLIAGGILAATLAGPARAEPAAAVQSPTAWKAKLLPGVSDPEQWSGLTGELLQKELYFGAVAAAQRMLLYFGDPESRDSAYRTVIQSVRGGYPFPLHDLFREGELQPSIQDSFTDAYFTYKGVINEKSGAKRWSDAFFGKIDGNRVPEFLYYRGLQAYAAKDLDKALEFFGKLFDPASDSGNRVSHVAAARTIARIRFEKEQYDKSLDIYDHYLLRLNPMQPSDWLEAAWDLFYLKRYDQALGYLYNLESPSSDFRYNLEKYLLRGLIYRQLCASQALESLRANFDVEFGGVIRGIKFGLPLSKYPMLRMIRGPGSDRFRRNQTVLEGLQAERVAAGAVRRAALANYLYEGETKRIEQNLRVLDYDQLSYAAEQLLLTSEELAFLRFELQRADIDPAKVFENEQRLRERPIQSVGDPRERAFSVKWRQTGDFWRSERLIFGAEITSQCKR